MKPQEIIDLVNSIKEQIESEGLIATADEITERLDIFFKEQKNDYEAHRHDHEE